MEATVLLCTYNNSASLLKTLNSIGNMEMNDNIKYEVLVVDNNSKDETKDVIHKAAAISKVPMRYVFESKQGLSHARNSGVHESRGDIIAFTDDDVIVEKDWLNNILRTFNACDAVCIGGKIFPIWESPPPSWLTPELYGYLALLDYGNEVLQLKKPDIWGANIAIRKGMFNKYGYFDAKLGRTSNKYYAGEETEYIYRLISNNESVIYVPDVIVNHYVPNKKMKKDYFRKWLYDKGELEAINMGYYDKRNIYGVPYYILNDILSMVIKYPIEHITLMGNKLFLKQLDIIRKIGFINGRISGKWKAI